MISFVIDMFEYCCWWHLGIQVKIKLRRTSFRDRIGKILGRGNGLAVALVGGRGSDGGGGILLGVGMNLETHKNHIILGEDLLRFAAVGELEPHIQTGTHPGCILAVSFRHSDVELFGMEVFCISAEGRGQLRIDTGGRNGAVRTLTLLAGRSRQLDDKTASFVVESAVERLRKQTTVQSHLKNIEVVVGLVQKVGKGDQLSGGGSGGVFVGERPDSGFDGGDNLVKGTTVPRGPGWSSGFPKRNVRLTG